MPDALKPTRRRAVESAQPLVVFSQPLLKAFQNLEKVIETIKPTGPQRQHHDHVFSQLKQCASGEPVPSRMGFAAVSLISEQLFDLCSERQMADHRAAIYAAANALVKVAEKEPVPVSIFRQQQAVSR